jgi:hypothetical protein
VDEELSEEELQQKAASLIEELEESTYDFSEKELLVIERSRERVDAGKLLSWYQIQQLQYLLDRTQ